jgi:hypothetical protein
MEARCLLFSLSYRVTTRYGVFCVLRYVSTFGFTTTDCPGWFCKGLARSDLFLH